MSNDTSILRKPRPLTKLELVDIHLLVKSTSPRLGIIVVPKKAKDAAKA